MAAIILSLDHKYGRLTVLGPSPRLYRKNGRTIRYVWCRCRGCDPLRAVFPDEWLQEDER